VHVAALPYPDLLALESNRIVARCLPKAVDDGSNLEAREAMAWADALAGFASRMLVLHCPTVSV